MPHTVKLTSENIAECEAVARLLKEANEKTGMTQPELGKMIGKSAKTISGIVNKRMRVTVPVARKLAKAFGVPVTEILPWVAELSVESAYSDIIEDYQELSDENQAIVRRTIRNLIDSQEDI